MRSDFTEFDLPDRVTETFPPDRSRLFDLVRSQTTDEMLEAVSRADYGQDAPAHLLELKRIRDGINLESPITWNPNEVLSLFRWGEFESEKLLTDRLTFHQARAFCAGALLCVPDQHENRQLLSNEAVAPLIESCTVLGVGHLKLLAQQLVAQVQLLEPWDQDFLFNAFGLVATVNLLPDSPKETVEELEEWFMHAHTESLAWHITDQGCKIGTFLDIPNATISRGRWARIASRIIPARAHAPDFAELLVVLQVPPSLKARIRSNWPLIRSVLQIPFWLIKNRFKR